MRGICWDHVFGRRNNACFRWWAGISVGSPSVTDDNDHSLFYWMTGHKLLCERVDRHRRRYEQCAGFSGVVSLDVNIDRKHFIGWFTIRFISQMSLTWTDKLLNAFKRNRSYDKHDCLPHLPQCIRVYLPRADSRFPPLSHFLSTKTCLPAAKWRRINLTNENKYRQRCLTLIKAGSRTQREDWCTTSRVFWVCRWPVFYPDVSLWALIMRIYSWPLVLDAGHTHQLQKHEQRGLFLTLYWGSQCLKSRFNERLKASLSFVVYADTLFARSFVIKTLLIVLLQWAILHTCNP